MASVLVDTLVALVAALTWAVVIKYLIILLLTWLCYSFLIQPFFSPLRQFPGPPYNPIFGNTRESMKGQTMEASLRWTQKYGLIMRHYFVFGRERLLVADPEALKHIMVTNVKNYIKPKLPGSRIVTKILGNGLVFTNNPKHAYDRKLINPSFKLTELRKMIPKFQKYGSVLQKHWTKQLGKSTEPWTEIQIAQDLSRASLDAIGACAFSAEFRSIEDPDNALATAFNSMLTGQGLSWRIFIPFYQYMPFEENRQFNSKLALIDKTIRDIISERLKILGNTKGDGDIPKDLLTTLMLARDEDTLEGLSNQDLRDHIMTFLFAGHETTSTAMSWVLLLLAEHPDIQERVREEARRILPPDGSSITMDHADQLVYLNNTVKETLRFYPPVPNVIREAVHSDTIGGKHIPAGTKVLPALGCMMRHPSIWKEPEKFNPDRFEGEASINPYHFLPFVTGPRMCIGYKFALIEMRVILALVVRDLEFSLAPDYTFRRKQTVTMRPDPPLRLRVRLANQDGDDASS